MTGLKRYPERTATRWSSTAEADRFIGHGPESGQPGTLGHTRCRGRGERRCFFWTRCGARVDVAGYRFREAGAQRPGAAGEGRTRALARHTGSGVSW